MLIDTSALKITRAGVSFYIIELLKGLRRLPYPLYIEERSYQPAFSRESKLRAIDSIVRDTVWQDMSLSRMASREGFDITHYPAFSFPYFHKGNILITIHDLYPVRHPENFSYWHRRTVNAQIKRAVKTNKPILVPSAFTKAEILELFPDAKAEKIFPIHSGVPVQRKRIHDSGKFLDLLRKLRIPEDYLLSVSTIEPRKNFSSLIKAFACIKDKVSYSLVLVGQSGWKNSEVYGLIRNLGLSDRVIFTGYVSDDDLNLLYSNALCFVFPSSYEGFGFTPLEAMKCGCPVLSSDASCMPEILGKAAVYFDPFNIEEIASRILEVAEDREMREYLGMAGVAHAARYSWDLTADRTYGLYRAIVNGEV